MQIPVGWQMQGGMLDLFGIKRVSITAASPDNRNIITIGTNTLELIIMPNSELDALGYEDGHVFIQDTGIVVAVSPFRSGAKSAQIMVDNNIVIAAQVLQYMVHTMVYNPAWIGTQLASADQTVTTFYDVFRSELADSALLDATLSQIIGMSQHSLMETIASMDGTYEYDYEFLP